MGIPIPICKGCNTKFLLNPCCDCNLENNNKKNNNLRIVNVSINLPNSNSMNSYFESKGNQNEEEGFNISLSPITKTKKNSIAVKQMNLNYESSNNKCNSSNIDTNKIYEPIKINKENIVKEESYVKEESNSQEENNSNKNSKEINITELINEFDNNIKKYAEYISEEQFENTENSIIKEIEKNLKEFSIDSKSSNNFERPPLLFKNNNSKYKGFWNKEGKKSGFGIFYDSSGNKYIGKWDNDKFNGKGRIISINGDYYEGDFKYGNIEGTGIFVSKKEKYKYFGNFRNNKFHGRGKIIYEDNNIIYEGGFIEGYKQGFGKITFEDNSYYQGFFNENNFHGNGAFYFKDKRNYIGDWKKNTMSGKGIFSWGNECKYKGEYKNNLREGSGVYSFGCNLYDGEWINGLPHGEGILLINGLKIVANFRYGKILEMKYGKGVNKELTQKISISVDSIVINKSLDYNYRGTERTEIDSKNYKKSNTSDFVNLSVKKEKKKENKKKNNNNNKYRNHSKLNKNKSNEKEKKEIKKKKDNGKRKISKK
jgi:hypothetical protein